MVIPKRPELWAQNPPVALAVNASLAHLNHWDLMLCGTTSPRVSFPGPPPRVVDSSGYEACSFPYIHALSMSIKSKIIGDSVYVIPLEKNVK